MNKIELIYPEAVKHTQEKVLQDIMYYLHDKEEIPSFKDYYQKRKDYIEQIWQNVWINRASNGVPRVEKKDFLKEKGYEVEGIDKKIINKLFRSEIIGYKPFPIDEWVRQTYDHQDKQWSELYVHAREKFKKQLEEENRAKEIGLIKDEIEKEKENIINEQRLAIYLELRKFVADQMKRDFEIKPRYQRVETFSIEKRLIPQAFFLPSDYKLALDFFQELTGEIQRVDDWGQYSYEYQSYLDVYQQIIFDYLFENLPKTIRKRVSFEKNYDESIILSAINEVMEDTIIDLGEEYITAISQEYISDLLRISEIPFERNIHEKIYFDDIRNRKIKIAEEKAERRRQKELETKIMNDIFELEYNLPTNRNVRYVLHIGETNTGKTFNALQKMKEAESGLYLAPLRLLALEVFDLLNSDGTPCSLKTGEEEKIIPNSNHISCTVEMFYEKDYFDIVVIDESQMIADKERGFSWYKAITKVQANEVHIIASFNAKDMLIQLLGDSKIDIHEYKREAPLEVEKKQFNIKHVKKGDALICFSRKRVLETASRLQNNGKLVSMIYGSMPPETRKKQVERFLKGETNIVVATDAIGMGLNLPIQRIVFLENHKFDGTKRRLLTSQEVKQIAGRAGRKGLYPVGKVAFTEDIAKMKVLLLQEDDPIQSFTIAPTKDIFDRFQQYYHEMNTFFELWDKFKNPKGTKKATLTEEKELYRHIYGTEIEARLSLVDLYGLLHLPFSSREPDLVKQWKKTVDAIVNRKAMPEPKIKKRTLEDLELSYKAVGLHLLFLYRLNKRTDAVFWERIREELSEEVHEKLKTEVKNIKKRCRNCNKTLSWDYPFLICQACYERRYNYYDDPY